MASPLPAEAGDLETLLELAHKYKLTRLKVGGVEFEVAPAAYSAPAPVREVPAPAAPPEPRLEFMELGPEEKMPTPEEMLFLSAAELVEDDPVDEDEPLGVAQ